MQLTVIGMIGSVIAGVSLIGANWSSICLAGVVLGIAMNWFGDSLDGSLARFRQEERPRFGFLVDHSCDLLSQVIIITAFGLSPYLSLISALVILLCYLLFSAYTYIRAATQHIHQMSYIGVGATEFRLLMIVWACIGTVFGLREPLANGLSGIDFAILIMAVFAVFGLLYKLVVDAREIAAEENAGLAVRTETTSEADPDLEEAGTSAFR